VETHSQGEDYSRSAVPKSQPENIILDKLGFGIKNDLKEIGFSTVLVKLPGTDVGIEVDLVEKRFKRSMRGVGNIEIGMKGWFGALPNLVD